MKIVIIVIEKRLYKIAADGPRKVGADISSKVIEPLKMSRFGKTFAIIPT